MRRVLMLLRHVLAAVAVLCLGSWTAVKVYAHVAGLRNAAILDRLVSERRGPGVMGEMASRLPAKLRPGTLLGRIDLPRVGLSAVVFESTGERWLEQGAGHVPGTALPGGDGNAVVAGHRDSYFRGLRRVELGDVITVTTPDATRRYSVDSFHLVDPDDTRVLAPSDLPGLTLITCFPFTYVGAAPLRFIVHAHLVLLDPATGAALHDHRFAFDNLEPARPPTLHASPRRTVPTRPRPHPRSVAHGRLPAARKSLAPVVAAPKKLSWWRRLFHTNERALTPSASSPSGT